ncbi:MAG: cell division protein [Methylococcaceae bacterium]|nr:MAG: cell division protein [Methylococcaceae bacterium]
MDKELLRVVIIAVGLLVVVGMLGWHFFKNKNLLGSASFFSAQRPDDDEEDDNEDENEDDAQDNDKLVAVKEAELSEPPVQQDLGEPQQAAASVTHTIEDDDLEEQAPRFVAPEIIQFSVVAKTPEGFNGMDLRHAFLIAHMDYGKLKIYERIDENRMVDFGAACLVEPGTFPETDLDLFFCPGVVFFMQPGILDDAQKVFNDFLEAVNLVAFELDGNIIDHERKPLTNATISLLKQSI